MMLECHYRVRWWWLWTIYLSVITLITIRINTIERVLHAGTYLPTINFLLYASNFNARTSWICRGVSIHDTVLLKNAFVCHITHIINRSTKFYTLVLIFRVSVSLSMSRTSTREAAERVESNDARLSYSETRIYRFLTHNYSQKSPIINHFNDKYIWNQLLGSRR